MEHLKILLVEDEKKIATALKSGLEEQGYNVTVATDGKTGEQYFNLGGYNLIILDINLPGINGFSLSRLIRTKNKEIPVLMLTALNTTDDKVEGFEAGADDYLVKPFAFKELLARIRSLLRRSVDVVVQQKMLSIADLEINLEEKSVKRAGHPVSLTAKEFQLLEYLVRNKNKMLSRAEIAGNVWDIKFDTGTNVIDVYINFLRKKIDKDHAIKLIHTQVGMGYILKDEQP